MSSHKFSFLVDSSEAGQRLDRFLAARAELAALAISRTRVKSLIESGCVRLDGAPLSDAAQKIAAGAQIEIFAPEAVEAIPQGESIPLTVIFEDDHLIVIDKPAGLVVHPGAGHGTGTLVNALIAHCGASLSGIGGVMRPGIVHRLDKDTSGLLVVAKTDIAHRGLAAQFADHGRTMDFLRGYVALVWGAPDRRSGTIDAPLARHPTHREKIAVRESGRAAITHWRLEARFGRDRLNRPIAARIACELETGRTHQIRVHMAHIGHPLIGDSTYGSGFKTKAAQLPPQARACVESFPRQALHAARLAFTHPVTEEFIDLTSELPEDIARLEERLNQDAQTKEES